MHETDIIIRKRLKPRGTLPLALVVGIVITAEAANIGGYVGDFTHLQSDNVIMTLLSSTLLLLVGVLIRMRNMRAALQRKANALRKSEEHVRLMGDNLPNVTIFQLSYVPENGFRFDYLSKGCERTLGFNRDAIMANASLAYDHVYEADLPVLRQAFRNGIEKLAAINMELRVLDHKGELKWLQVSAVPHIDDNELVWDGFMQDISDNKHIENALMEENRNFQNLFETIDDFLIVCDMDGRLIHTNPALHQRLGFSKEELADMSIFELHQEELQPEIYRVIARMQSEQTAMCSIPLRKREGGKIPVEMNIFQGSWKNQKSIFAVARDIGSRQRTETALQESQRMLRLIMDTIPMSVFWKDHDSVYLGCNKTFAQECGLNNIDEVVGKTPCDLFDAEAAEAILRRDREVIATNQPMLGVLQSQPHPDGSMGWLEINKIPLRDENGMATGVLGVWRDVTEQSRAEERLKRTLEDMERFNQLMRGRERRTLELKAEVNTLLRMMEQPEKYRTTTDSLA